MARLWLCTILTSILTLGGCLFIGDVNGLPSVELDIKLASAAVGMPLYFTATLYDDQPLPKAEIAVYDGNGNPADPCAFTPPSSSPPDANPQSFIVTFWQAGDYVVKVTPVDALGAYGSPAIAQVSIAVDAPSFVDPSAAIAPENAGVACGSLYTPGAPIPIRLNAPVNDPEASAVQSEPMTDPAGACAQPPKLSLVWQLTTLPNNSTAKLGPPNANGTSCPTTPTNGVLVLVTDASVDLICLYVDDNLPATSPSMYGVTVSAQQGDQETTSDELMIPAIGNAPACLDGVYPVVGSYVLAGDEVTIFQAIGVDELSTDVAGLDFLWSIEGPNDTSYTPLGVPATAAEGGDRFSFDPTTLGYAVGDEVHLRVEVSDPAQPAAACAPTDDVCAAASCAAAPATTCPRRATWDIEVR